MKAFVAFIFVIGSLFVLAQDSSKTHREIMDLEKKIRNADTSEKGMLYFRLAEKWGELSPQRSLNYSDSSLSFFSSLKDSSWMLKATMVRASALYALNRYKESFTAYETVYETHLTGGNDSLLAEMQIGMGASLLGQEAYENAFIHYEDAADRLQRSGDFSKLARILMYLGSAQHLMGKYGSALDYFHQALETNDPMDQEVSANIYNNMGIVFFDVGNFEKALDHYLKSLNIVEETGDLQGSANALNNIGIVYYEWGNLEKALEYYQKSLRLEQQLGHISGVADSYNNIGIIYSDWDQNELAIRYYEKALAIYQSSGYEQGIADVKNNIGESLSAMEEYFEALEYLQESTLLEAKLGNARGLAQSYHATAMVYHAMKRYTEALEYNSKSMALADSVGLDQIKMLNAKLFSDIFENTGNTARALEYFRMYKTLEDSIYNQDFQRKLADLQGMYAVEMREREKQQLLEAAAKGVLGFKKQWIYLVLILLLMGVVGVLIYFDFRAKARISNKLKQFHSQLNGEKIKVSETLDKLIRSEEMYRTLVDNSLQGMLIVKRGRVTFANPTIASMTQYSVEEIRQAGKRWLSLLVHPEDKPRAYKNVRFALAGKPFETRQKYRIAQKDGQTRVMETLSTIAPFQDSPAMLIVAIDVTDQVSAHEKLQQSEQKLRELNATKDKFFSILAHDLKNPFSSIIGFANLLREAYDDLSDVQRKEFIRDICTASEHTFKLLQNLLDWSGTQTGSFGYLPDLLSVSSILNETFDMLKPAFDRKNISVNIDVPDGTLVYADENMLRLVLRNVLSNALKFSHRGGKVKLEGVGYDKETQIRVQDFGVGISKQNLENLFRIDKQIRAAGTENESGTGLGLILSKEFIKINKGSIRVESEPGKGTTFTIGLPRSAPVKVSE